MDQQAVSRSIAIVGMAGRFPGARNVREFWDNLVSGQESITKFSSDQLDRSRIPRSVYESENYRPFAGVCPDADLFDATLFGYSAKDAQIIDPNQRILLQISWEALESAGYNPLGLGDISVGIFAGQTVNTYVFNNIIRSKDLLNDVSATQILVANDKDYLATRCSYKLGLNGPSITVQTACSTSLVAVHLACQSLLFGDCDMALAGAASIKFPQESGYFATDGDVLSFDGHCRAFDADATGTVPGNGAGIVLLKRLEDAQSDGDLILAVIRGSAINNDGCDKASFTSPNVAAQAAVIREAYAVSGVSPESVGFVEAHGTGTAIGDPIEIAALLSVFNQNDASKLGSCYLGSVKSNIGHLDTAAGIAGLIKAVLAVKYGIIPPTLHWRSHNKNVKIDRPSFIINPVCIRWKQSDEPRRAGISSFGFGGTNAHIVIEEAPKRSDTPEVIPSCQIIPLSAASTQSLAELRSNLANHLEQCSDCSLSDIAYTLQVGRATLPIRSSFAANSIKASITKLREARKARSSRPTETTFLFPGQGTSISIDDSLYHTESTFRSAIDRCGNFIYAESGLDVTAVIFRSHGEGDRSIQRVSSVLAQSALFTIEYALAKLWQSRGVEPNFVLGHSLGEYVAAHIAGVFTLQDALRVVVSRGKLMEGLSEGAMLSVLLSEEKLSDFLPEDISIAAVNGPDICVVSGPSESIKRFSHNLSRARVVSTKINTSYAFHSAGVEPMLSEFRAILCSIVLNAPSIPFISTLTGKVAKAELCDVDYWIQQTRNPVRFHEAILQVARGNRRVNFLDIGTDGTLSRLVKQNPLIDRKTPVISSLCNTSDSASEQFCNALSEMWDLGLDVTLSTSKQGRRVVLPTYPFHLEKHWVEPHEAVSNEVKAVVAEEVDMDILSVPVWDRSVAVALRASEKHEPRSALFIGINNQWNHALQSKLKVHFDRVDLFPLVLSGREQQDTLSVSKLPLIMTSLMALFRNIPYTDVILSIADLFDISINEQEAASAKFKFLVSIIRTAMEVYRNKNLRLVTVTNGLFEIHPDDRSIPSNAILIGPILSAPREYPNLSCYIIDALCEDQKESEFAILASEIAYLSEDYLLVLRGKIKWLRRLQKLRFENKKENQIIRSGGTFLIVGGAGFIGSNLAEFLIQHYNASVIVMSRSVDCLQAAQDTTDHNGGAYSSPYRDLMLAKKDRVLAIRGDVTKSSDVKQAIRLGKEFGCGRIDGVFHLAGVAGNGLMDLKTEEDIDRVLAPKVSGTVTLIEELFDESVDFIVLFSSLSSYLPTVGQADYSAANSFQSHYARKCALNTSTKVISIAWDWWAAKQSGGPGVVDSGGVEKLTTTEAFSTLEKALKSDKVELVASKRSTMALNDWDSYDKIDRPISFDVECLTSSSAVDNQVLAIWRRVLGSDVIGIDDDFIAAGGHSLSAMRIISHVQQAFRTNLSFRQVFDSMRTARAMSDYISSVLKSSATGVYGELDSEVEALASDILEMSEAEIENIIRDMQSLNECE